MKLPSQISPVSAQRRRDYDNDSFSYVTTGAESDQPVGAPWYQWGCRDAGITGFHYSGSWQAQGGPAYICRDQRKHVCFFLLDKCFIIYSQNVFFDKQMYKYSLYDNHSGVTSHRWSNIIDAKCKHWFTSPPSLRHALIWKFPQHICVSFISCFLTELCFH